MVQSEQWTWSGSPIMFRGDLVQWSNELLGPVVQYKQWTWSGSPMDLVRWSNWSGSPIRAVDLVRWSGSPINGSGLVVQSEQWTWSLIKTSFQPMYISVYISYVSWTFIEFALSQSQCVVFQLNNLQNADLNCPPPNWLRSDNFPSFSQRLSRTNASKGDDLVADRVQPSRY